MPKKGNEIVFSGVNDPKRELYRNYVIALSDGEPDNAHTPRSAALDRILSKYGIEEIEEAPLKGGENAPKIKTYGQNTALCYLDGDTLKAYSDLKDPTHENLRQSLREGMILFFPEKDGMPRSLSCLRIGDEEYFQCLDVHQATELYTDREKASAASGVNFVPPGEPDLLARICDKFAMFFLGRHGAVMSQWLAYRSLDRAKTAFEEIEPLQDAIHDADAEREIEAERKRQREEEQERRRREEEEKRRR
ncbi:MAG: hypothetical protein J6S59_05500, partial [Clostridia bacterium]|nr:hypothetical protein [Clostridia bacterium]